MRADIRRLRRGFTLIEVTVALAVGAVVVLMASRLFGSLLDGADRSLQARLALDRASNARRVLTALVQGVEVGMVPGGDFEGGPTRVTFTTWMPGPRGWAERRRVSLGASDSDLTVRGLGRPALRLADGVTSFEIDYLLDYGAAERWGRSWMSQVSAPFGLRLRIARAGGTDTLLLLVGPRG